jgi:hypothetical protein
MRILVIVAAAGLAGCSSLFDPSNVPGPPSDYVPPNQPTRAAELQGIANAAKEEKLLGEVEISPFRESDFGPGRWVACMRGSRIDGPAFFAVFFENESYKGVRLPVMTEDCEHQSYSPTGPLPLPKIDVKSPTAAKGGSPFDDLQRR